MTSNAQLTAPTALTLALDTLTGREYRRVSLDRFGKKSSVNEQGAANAVGCARHGITIGVPYKRPAFR